MIKVLIYFRGDNNRFRKNTITEREATFSAIKLYFYVVNTIYCAFLSVINKGAQIANSFFTSAKHSQCISSFSELIGVKKRQFGRSRRWLFWIDKIQIKLATKLQKSVYPFFLLTRSWENLFLSINLSSLHVTLVLEIFVGLFRTKAFFFQVIIRLYK